MQQNDEEVEKRLNEAMATLRLDVRNYWIKY